MGMVYAPNKPIKVGTKLVRRATSQQEVQLDWEKILSAKWISRPSS